MARTSGTLSAILLLACFGGAPAAAEQLTVEQSKTFSIFETRSFGDAELKSGSAHNQSGTGTVIFDAFDPALGTLIGITAKLTSTQEFDYGVRIISPAGTRTVALEADGGYGSAVQVGGQVLGRNDLSVSAFSRAHAACQSSPDVGACIDTDTLTSSFGFESPVALDALTAGGLTFSLPWLVDMSVHFGGPPSSDPLPIFDALSTISWAGQIDLTYTYEAVLVPSVPEPAAWAMMIAGFGLAGGAVRLRLRGRRPAERA